MELDSQSSSSKEALEGEAREERRRLEGSLSALIDFGVADLEAAERILAGAMSTTEEIEAGTQRLRTNLIWMALCLMNSMIKCGESHSEYSIATFRAAIEANDANRTRELRLEELADAERARALLEVALTCEHRRNEALEAERDALHAKAKAERDALRAEVESLSKALGLAEGERAEVVAVAASLQKRLGQERDATEALRAENAARAENEALRAQLADALAENRAAWAAWARALEKVL